MKLGETIEDFDFDAYYQGKFVKKSLGEYSGRWVILFFYPRNFSFVCPTEIKEFSKKNPDFEKEGAVVLGASTDSLYAHKSWFETSFEDINFPVIADTSHEISEQFNVLQEDGSALRGTFIIDPDGILQYMVVSNNDVGRNIEETWRVFMALKTSGLCPVGWKPGDANLKGLK